MSPTTPPPSVTEERIPALARASLLQKLGGYVTTQLIYFFAKLGVADQLITGAKSSGALAEALALPHDTLQRLSRGWLSVGLLSADASGAFTSTPLATLLETDRADSLRDYALLAGEEWYPAWNGLSHLLTSKRTPFEQIFGCDYYSHLMQKPEAGARFNRFMEARTAQTAQALLDLYDFATTEVIVDIGGGNGTLLQGIITAYPHLQGFLFEQPNVVTTVEEQFATEPLGTRCQVVGGNFFYDVPPAGDLYILSQILHNWNDEECRQILRNCYQGIQPEGRLLLIEQIIPIQIQANQPAVEADLMMLVLLDGRERMASEYERLLHDTGFVMISVQPLKRLGFSLVEAKRQTPKGK